MNYNANVPQDVTDVTDKNDADIDEYIVKSIRINPAISTFKIDENLNYNIYKISSKNV